MRGVEQGLLPVVRDFLVAHRLLPQLASRYRAGELQFDELQELVSDDERSALYRLKERCHGLFRGSAQSGRLSMPREALFDVAVGSLFHESMKFRENFYQREVYGPRVRALRAGASEDAAGLFEEFEKILAAVSQRLEEGLQEALELLEQMGKQLRYLLREHRDEGLLTRFLMERPAEIEEVFASDFDALLAEIHGSTAVGYRVAGLSYLASGYYVAAQSALAKALERGGDPAELGPLEAFARGMEAYLARDYTESLSALSQWARQRGDEPAGLARLARAAISRVGQLADVDERERLAGRATELLAQL
jgi:hypothetical protein